VAHSLSAKKRVRQAAKRRAQNRYRKELIKDQVKAFSSAITAADWTKAEEELRKVTKRLDSVSTKGTLHKNTAARKRSRLAKRLNAARVASANKPAGGEKPARGGRKGKGAATTSA